MLCRWILPFNRELTLGALAQAPLIPWRWKMDATHWWLKRYFYGPAGIVHMMPGAGNKAAPRDNDYAGKGASTLSSRCAPPGVMRVLEHILRLLHTVGSHPSYGSVNVEDLMPCGSAAIQSPARVLGW